MGGREEEELDMKQKNKRLIGKNRGSIANIRICVKVR